MMPAPNGINRQIIKIAPTPAKKFSTLTFVFSSKISIVFFVLGPELNKSSLSLFRCVVIEEIDMVTGWIDLSISLFIYLSFD